jgi:hypothetical protein
VVTIRVKVVMLDLSPVIKKREGEVELLWKEMFVLVFN